VYGTDAQFRHGVPEPALVERIERAAQEATNLHQPSITSL
jgi:hypothetical protein